VTVLCFIDTESTGLDRDVHMPWEVCWWREDESGPTTSLLPHTLDRADPVALEINRYHEREIQPDWCDPDRWFDVALLTRKLAGVTLVGSNPGFDAGMLGPLLRGTPWHHRVINVADGAMFLFRWDRPSGLDKIATECRARGYVIPEPDHSAEGDVRATRAIYYALRDIRAGMQ
jgi:hypothetical protein